MPIFLNSSACCIGQTTASTSSSICLSKPPTSVYFSVGFSSTSIALTRLSYSAGSVSSTKYESLLTPMRSPGLREVWSTRPMRGRNIVCLVEVLMTADLPTRVASRSIFAPSSAASFSTSKSRSSTTLPTRYGNCLTQDISTSKHGVDTIVKKSPPVVLDFVQILLNLLLHRRLLMRQPLKLALHNPKIVVH